MKKILVWGIGFVVIAGALLWGATQLVAPAQVTPADAETFARANQLYEKGEYATAVNLYQQLVAQGVENADVYFNLGAALKASGDAKGASQAFERAYALAPRDSQIAHAANAVTGFIPALTQNETAVGALVVTMALALAALIVLERHWRVNASAL